MFQTLKENFEEFNLLPAAVKGVIAFTLLFAIGFALYFGIREGLAGYKIERLERDNFKLNRQAQTAMEKAVKAEQNAANEALRADSLETKLKAVEAKTLQSDEKINLQSQKSSDLRLRLNRVRNSQPANTSTDELEKQLCRRYGCR